MEKVPVMEGKTDSHMTSAAAFVEGGIQESCDDACSICLEEFCESDPSTVTNCKHEFHLQCILEWCQRSSHCPMCWQTISLKDPTSQELFEAVERERSLRISPPRNAAVFHHPAFGDFGLQHLRMGDADFEERLIQHLAAAVGRTHHLGRREGQRTTRSSAAPGHPHFLIFSTQPNASSSSHSPAERANNEPTGIPTRSPSMPLASDGDEPSQQIPHLQTLSSSSGPGSTVQEANHQGIHSNDRDKPGPSEIQSLTDSLRSRLNAVSMRYKESMSSGARGWKERLFSRSSSMPEQGSEVRRDDGIAIISRLMESLGTRGDHNRAAGTSLLNHMEDRSIAEASNQNKVEASGENPSRDNNAPPAGSASSHSS